MSTMLSSRFACCFIICFLLSENNSLYSKQDISWRKGGWEHSRKRSRDCAFVFSAQVCADQLRLSSAYSVEFWICFSGEYRASSRSPQWQRRKCQRSHMPPHRCAAAPRRSPPLLTRYPVPVRFWKERQYRPEETDSRLSERRAVGFHAVFCTCVSFYVSPTSGFPSCRSSK